MSIRFCWCTISTTICQAICVIFLYAQQCLYSSVDANPSIKQSFYSIFVAGHVLVLREKSSDILLSIWSIWTGDLSIDLTQNKNNYFALRCRRKIFHISKSNKNEPSFTEAETARYNIGIKQYLDKKNRNEAKQKDSITIVNLYAKRNRAGLIGRIEQKMLANYAAN